MCCQILQTEKNTKLKLLWNKIGLEFFFSLIHLETEPQIVQAGLELSV